MNAFEKYIWEKAQSTAAWILFLAAASCFFLSDKFTFFLCILGIVAPEAWLKSLMEYTNPKLKHWFENN